jgi:heavy metal translocating P-type ATPase
VTEQGSPLRYEVVHSSKGRLRVRVPRLRDDPEFADGFVRYFIDCAGISGVRVNRWCGSAVITYDPGLLTSSEAQTAVAAAQPIPATAVGPVDPHLQPSLLNRVLGCEERMLPPGRQLLLGAVAAAAVLLGVPQILATTLLAASVTPILARAVRTALDERRAGVDALDGTAAILMIARGNVVAGSLMTALIGLGEYIRERTARHSQTALSELEGLLAGRSAWLVQGKRRVRVPIDQVRAGDMVVAYPGDMIPVDGMVLRGRGFVDQRSMSGESMPAELGPGDQVYASTVVIEGKIYLRCQATGEETQVRRMVGLVRNAPLYETRAQNYASAMADKLVLPIFATAGIALAATHELSRAVSVLIIDFATGVRIAAPTAVLTSMQRAARRGVLIKGGGALERLAATDAMIFDKTGTLTRGEPQVTTVVCLNGLGPGTMLSLAASAEQTLRHPAALAILRRARQEGLSIPERTNSTLLAGMGIRARIDGASVLVGSERLMTAEGIGLAVGTERSQALMREGASLGYVAVDGELVGIIGYADPPRSDARAVIAALRRRGVRDIVMVTGDHDSAAQAVAVAAGIDRVVSGAMPADKVTVIDELRARGRTVAVVGDGINDSPALAHADVSIAMHGGADICRERADIVLTDDALERLPEAIDVAREAMRLVHQDVLITGVCNGVGLVLAATGMIGPGFATVINNGSAVLTSLNSLRPLLSRGSLPLDMA